MSFLVKFFFYGDLTAHFDGRIEETDKRDLDCSFCRILFVVIVHELRCYGGNDN